MPSAGPAAARSLEEDVDWDEEDKQDAEVASQGSAGSKAKEDSEVSEPEEIKVPTRELTEIDRLRYVVCAIENDCHIAPLGAYKMTSDH